VGEVQLEPIEAGADGSNDGLHMLIPHQIHVFSGHLPRHLGVGAVFDGRRADDLPIALVERVGVGVPRQLGGALSTGMTDLDSDLRLRMGVDELGDPLPFISLLFGPDANVAG